MLVKVLLHSCTILLIGLTSLCPVNAALVEDLYRGKIAVPNQLANTRQAALKQALSQVLVKITGSAAYLQRPQAKSMLSAASQYLTGFSYDIQNSQQYYLASFDEQKINSAIKLAGLPIWGKRRPETLVWIAFQANADSFERRLVAETSSSTLKQSLDAAALRRGIPLRLPLLDLSDRQNVSVFDVWNEALQRISEASVKYTTDYALSVRIFPNSIDAEASHTQIQNETPYVFLNKAELLRLGLSEQELKWQYFLQQQAIADAKLAANASLPWSLEWSHFDPDNLNSFRSGSLYADSPEQALANLVDLIANMMASEFALELRASADNSVRLTIKGIDSLTDYTNSISFLQELVVVGEVRLVEINADKAILNVSLTGTEQDLKNALSLDERVSLRTNEYGELTGGLDYNWLKR